MVHKFITSGSVEEKIDRMIREKSRLAEDIIGSGEDWLGGRDVGCGGRCRSVFCLGVRGVSQWGTWAGALGVPLMACWPAGTLAHEPSGAILSRLACGRMGGGGLSAAAVDPAGALTATS